MPEILYGRESDRCVLDGWSLLGLVSRSSHPSVCCLQPVVVLQATNCGEKAWLPGWVLQAGACNMKILALWNEGKICMRQYPVALLLHTLINGNCK